MKEKIKSLANGVKEVAATSYNFTSRSGAKVGGFIGYYASLIKYICVEFIGDTSENARRLSQVISYPTLGQFFSGATKDRLENWVGNGWFDAREATLSTYAFNLVAYPMALFFAQPYLVQHLPHFLNNNKRMAVAGLGIATLETLVREGSKRHVMPDLTEKERAEAEMKNEYKVKIVKSNGPSLIGAVPSYIIDYILAKYDHAKNTADRKLSRSSTTDGEIKAFRNPAKF